MLLCCAAFFGLQAQTTNQGNPKSWTEKNVPQQIDYKIMPSFDLAAERQTDAINDANYTGPWRFGYKHLVQYNLQNSGTWHTLADGSRIWRLGLYSKDALTMNLLLENVQLPDGANLYLYNPRSRELRGAYTAANNNTDRILGTTLLTGEELVLEYYEPRNVQGQGSLTVAAVVHGYRSMRDFPGKRVKGLNDSGDCNHDVNCPLGVGWQDAINSVALIVVGGNGACSGALINNTSNDGTPYFLSANHCGTTNLNNWVFRFNWDSPVASCAQTSLSQSPNSPFNEINGATLRANSSGSDFSLMELNSIPTGDVYYAGWDRSTTPAIQTTGIHHPNGDVKKICRDDDPPVVANYFGASVWEVTDWDLGVTEGGSSGSPLFNQNQLIIGQLYGGGAACAGVSDNGFEDNYGRLDVSWNGATSSRRLRDWLDPIGTNKIQMVGYNPNGNTLALDAGLLQLQGIKDTYCNEDSIRPIVTLRNYGSVDITSVQILYSLNGAPSSAYNWTGVLTSQNTTLVALPAVALGTGAQTFTVTSRFPNNGVDSNSTNNTTVKQFNVVTNGSLVEYSLALDCYGSEISWSLEDSATGNVLYSGGPYNDNFSTVDTLRTEFCLPEGCYRFIIEDSY